MSQPTSSAPHVPHFDALLSQLPVFVCLFDRDRRILWTNRWGFGCDDNLIGQRTEDNIHADDRDAWIHSFRCALDGQTLGGECRCYMPDGGPITRWQYWLAPYRVAGELAGVISVCRDVTLSPPQGGGQHHTTYFASGGSASSTGGCSKSTGGPGGSIHVDRLSRFLFTPASLSVVLFLERHGPAKGNTVAKHLNMLDGTGQNACSKLRFILSSLEERHVLKNGRDGYELTVEFATAWVHLHTVSKSVQQ